MLDRRLIRAAYANDLESAARLIAKGADVNHKDRSEQSAYLISTSEVGDDPRLLSMTLAAGADVHSLDSFDGTGLIRAADRGYPEVVRRLLRTDIRVDHVNNLGWTALHEAVLLGDGSRVYVRVVRLLIEAGADVNKPSRHDGIRPLQHAARRGFTAVADVLRAASTLRPTPWGEGSSGRRRPGRPRGATPGRRRRRSRSCQASPTHDSASAWLGMRLPALAGVDLRSRRLTRSAR